MRTLVGHGSLLEIFVNKLTCRNRSALAITDTEPMGMAPLAIMELRTIRTFLTVKFNSNRRN
jgi:hypothetical protein